MTSQIFNAKIRSITATLLILFDEIELSDLADFITENHSVFRLGHEGGISKIKLISILSWGVNHGEFHINHDKETVRLRKAGEKEENRIIKEWKKEDIEKLKKLFDQGYSDSYIAEELERSEQSVKNKRSMEGLTKIEFWTDNEIKKLNELNKDGIPIKKQAEILNKTTKQVTDKRAKLKLRFAKKKK